MKKIIIYISLFCILSINCKNYSSGWRSGVLIKLSKKGVFYKTWEATINLGGLKSTSDKDGNQSFVANTWDFSIDRKTRRKENIQTIVDSLQKAFDMGLPIKVHYNQEKVTDWNCSRGSECYFVDSVKIIY